jgi:hypothetical protein
MITIYTKPYTQLSSNLNPVYNGLPFVVDSSFTSASNFKYIAEVYYNNQKVSELRHHPDISNSKKGVFDVGRIIENFLSYDINIFNLQSTTGAAATFPAVNTVNGYYVNFGEEMSRVLTFKSIGTATGGALFNANEPNAMTAANGSLYNDYVFIQGSTIPSYNGWKRLQYRSGSNNFVLDTANAGQPDFSKMYAIQGQKIVRFSSTILNGITRLNIVVKAQGQTGRLQIGDRVIFTSTNASINQYYTLSEWNVMSNAVPENNLVYGQCWVYTLDCPYKFPIGASIQGAVISKDNYVFKNMVSTKLDDAYAWTGVRQYEDEYLTITADKNDKTWPSFYKRNFSFTQDYFKTLSDKPTKTVNICKNEVYQVASIGSWLNKVGSGAAARETHIRLETWSSDTSTTSSGQIQSATGQVAYQSLSYRMGTMAGTTFGVGDYITLTAIPSNISLTGRIVRVSYTNPYNYIHTDIAFDPVMIGSGTLTSTIKVRYRDALLQNTAQNFPCGPYNFKNYVEFISGACYKYFVYPIVPTQSSYYSATGGIPTSDNNGINFPGNRPICGEKWEFNIDVSCCSDMPTYKIMWLNKKGGFDFYKFTKRSDKKYTITREGFRRKLPNVQSSNIYGYKSGQRGETTYNTDSTETITINSDFLTQLELDWLVNIYESPEVYIVEDKGANPYIVPVTVVAEEVMSPNKTFRDESKGSLYQYQLVIEKSNKRVIQRGGSSGGAINSNSGTVGPIPGPVIGGGGWKPYEPWTNFTYTKSLYE